MENKVLYRKYRPQDFDSVVGQKHIIKTLVNELKTNTTVHAYIFFGPKGSGKTSIAKIFSKAINCLNPINNNPCNKCSNCSAINMNNSIDFIELDGASNSGVSEIRNLLESIEYAPSQLKTKIYIIDEAHMLTTSSWNALLKSIEEPPQNVVFIFATTEYNKIPSTIVSRSERFDFNRISNLDLKKLLEDVCKKEQIKITPIALEIIVNLADGAARDGLSILEQMRSYSSNDIKDNDLNEVFGLVSIDDKITFINNIISNNLQEVMMMINNFEQQGVDFYHLLFEIIEILMDCYIYNSTRQLILLKKVLTEQQLSNIIYSQNILEVVDDYNSELYKLKNTDKPRFVFEFIILKSLNKFKKNTNNNIQLFQNEQVENKDMSGSTKNMNMWRNSQSTEPFDGPSIRLNSLGDVEIEEETPPITKDIFRTKEIQMTSDVAKKMNATTNLNSSWDIEKETDIVPIEQVKKNNVELNTKEDFFAVAYNHNANIKEELNKLLVDAQESGELEMSPIINKFLKTKKFLIASPNGAFVLMDNKYLCDEFNNIMYEKEFLDYYKKTFGRQQKVIAIDKETARLYLDEYKNLKQQSFKDVTISINDENSDEAITQSLLEILNS